MADEALRYYHADGSYEVLCSASEVIGRRIAAAAELERLRSVNADLLAAVEALLAARRREYIDDYPDPERFGDEPDVAMALAALARARGGP